MTPTFVPPKDNKEFLERQEKIETQAVTSLLYALNVKRAQATHALDVEIAFYEAILKLRKLREKDPEANVDYPQQEPPAMAEEE